MESYGRRRTKNPPPAHRPTLSGGDPCIVNESIFAAPWWPLHVAVAWVLTRDREFTERVSSAGRTDISIDIALAVDQSAGRPAQTFEAGVPEAWHALFRAMADGRVPAAGARFTQRSAGTSAVERTGTRRSISAEEIGSLEYHRDGSDRCLIPTDWRAARSSNRRNLRGYRDVHVRSNALFAHFPPGGERVLSSEHVGTPTRPERGGFMPFTDAAYWIATKGGHFEIANIEDVSVWAPAYKELTDRIASGDVEIIGRGSGIGTPVKIAGYKFSNIGIDYPFTDTPDEMLFGKVPHVRCYLVRDLEHW